MKIPVLAAGILISIATPVCSAAVANTTTQTADVTFGKPAGKVGLSVIPEKLEARSGWTNTLGSAAVATVGVSATGDDVAALRWSPGKEEIDGRYPTLATLHGRNDTKHVLPVGFLTKGMGPGTSWKSGSDGWIYSDHKGNSFIAITTIPGNDIVADTYTVSLDAGVYTE